MKTVKDYIYKLDPTQLVDTYFEEYCEKVFDLYYRNNPDCYDDMHIDYDPVVRDLSVYDYAQAERKQLYDFIKYLQSVDITECSLGKTGIIYAFGKYNEDYCKRRQVRLLFKEDLIADPENCKNHSFAGVRFSEVLGYLVADNEYTQDIIYRVIAFVMYFSSYTGYRQENLERFYDSNKRYNGRDFVPYEPIDEWHRYSFGDDPTHINCNETAESQKKLNEARKAIYDYEMFTMRREREILLRSFGPQKSNSTAL